MLTRIAGHLHSIDSANASALIQLGRMENALCSGAIQNVVVNDEQEVACSLPAVGRCFGLAHACWLRKLFENPVGGPLTASARRGVSAWFRHDV